MFFYWGSYLLNKEDLEVVVIVQEFLIKDGIELILNVKLEWVELIDWGKVLYYRVNGDFGIIVVDEILVGVG